MPVDGFRAPQDIFTTQASDQGSRFWAEGWTASFSPRFPPPLLQKGIRMPLENRVWSKNLNEGLQEYDLS